MTDADSRYFKTVKERWFSEYVESEIPELNNKTIVITGTTSGTVNLLFCCNDFLLGFLGSHCLYKKES